MKSYFQCIYLDWPELDARVQEWATQYFGGHIKADTEREETDWEITLCNQHPTDKAPFTKLFDGQDDFSAEEEWHESNSLFIPTVIANQIASSFLKMAPVEKTMASYHGVLFLPASDSQ